MQHQRLAPGKPPQAPMNQGLAACRKVWHHDDDYIFRNGIRLQIIGLLQKHGLQKNLEEVSYWAERVLYMGAASKEEYGDLMTLENRLCSFMLRLRNGQKAAHHGLQQGSPVLQAPILGSSERNTPSPGSNYFQVSEVQLQCQQSPSTHQQLEKTSSADTGQSEVVNNDDSLAPGQVEETPPLQSTKWQQWFLVLLRHVSRCADLKPCTFPECEAGRKTWSHLTTCNSYPCSYPRCMQLKKLLWHHKNCRNSKCLICYPLRSNYSRQSLMAQVHMGKDMDMQSAVFVSELASHEFEPAPQKRRKLEAQVLEQQLQSTDGSLEQMTCGDVLLAPKHEMGPPFPVTKHTEHQASSSEVCKVESCSPRTESCPQSSLIVGPFSQYCTISEIVNGPNVVPDCVRDASVPQLAGPVDVKVSHESPKQFAVALKNDNKSANVRVSGISYLEILTPQQIKQHISNLREWIGQSDQALEEQEMPTSVCSTCGADELRFDPIPIFCTHCGCRIKRSAVYHTAGSGEKSLNLCGPCRSAIRGDVVETGHYKVHKSMLEKKTNDEQRAEGWVECDKCKKWQHQICGLFNARVNKETSEYFCPECCLAEMERGERMPCPENFMPRAKDLPRTALSDHVEERLAWKLKEEKVERATALGKSLEEVPSADGLVLRVVSSVDKKLEVKPRFLELFQQENYPIEFLYKSKMLILFQDIGGVEVCLFGMYVQEFGAENPQPNHRHTYLAYLDSVKYFHPDVKTIRGEALRTFVYHEILISYLDYCKKRGFSSCYIWACPPLKGDDYIFYSHPQIQKTPKPDKLREWYLSMIAKAKEEGVVVANTNMYDYYFTSNSDCKAKVTAARLPYFDGDYWPGAAEDILHRLQQEDNDLHSQRRGKAKKIAKKRTTKTSMQTEATSTMSRDLQLMYKLGHSIMAMKEDFIMVHMHHSCSYCHNFIVSGQRWFCELRAGDFQLCKHCYEDHQKLGVEEQHPIGKKECHLLSMEEVKDIPTDTVDEDEIIESEFYDNRHAFLGLCQGNQYQFDTLRRAKHSSMMVVYHLHNPNVPAFIICCSICQNGMETGHGWKCRVCPEFNVCNSCFSSPEVQGHHHEFVGQMTLADSNAGAFQQRMQLLRMRLETLVHASTCGDASCQQECRDMKTLFRHGCLCKQRAMGGCLPCKRMWYLLTCHARSCEKDPCTVPRCQDLKKHMRWMQQQQESQRRAAVNEMVRQRAAETSHI